MEFLSDTGRTDDASKLAAGTEESLGISADLLGLSTEELTGALLTRPLQVAREKFVKPNKVGEAQSARDALAKDVYLGIFNYLLKKINEATRYVEGGGGKGLHIWAGGLPGQYIYFGHYEVVCGEMKMV